MLVKENGLLAGIELIKRLYALYDSKLEFIQYKNDGDLMKVGDMVFKVIGSSQTILTTERTVLNILQRMSAIATLTNSIVEKVKHYPVKILDTRKTTPGFRFFEKEAVRIGGGTNHRFGLFDMVMLKDNHVDYAGVQFISIGALTHSAKSLDLSLKASFN